MRFRVPVLTLATLALVGALAAPAHAHADFYVAGFQYGYTEDAGAGLAGYVGVPSGNPVPVGEGVQTDEASSITNLDALPHTFTQCVAGCDTATPTYGTLFNVRVEPGSTESVGEIPSGSYVFGCRIHIWMRGAITIS